MSAAAALKLAHALDTLRDRRAAAALALDIGASTGGFTDVLLQRGARQVVALDVGHGQLDWRLRTDPRVVVLEHVNARFLEADGPSRSLRRRHHRRLVHLAAPDPARRPADVCRPKADVVALVKPQFEAGREDVGEGGLVTDPAVHERVVDEMRAAARAVGLTPVAETPSPITGATGNQEFLLHLRSAR